MKLPASLPPKPVQVRPGSSSSSAQTYVATPTVTAQTKQANLPSGALSPVVNHSTKRKLNDDASSDIGSSPPHKVHLSSQPAEDQKPGAPASVASSAGRAIPILETPLPSKRAKLKPHTRALLLPVEQLPVFPLPPLPVIEDEKLRKQVFTHQTLFDKVKGKFEEPEDNPATHYEKLEHVGDSLLGMIVTTWLHEAKPRLTCGTATKLKAHMVSNATLSHLSGLYGLPQRLNADPYHLPVLRVQTDVRAALMEAYIAAVYFSYPASERISTALPILDSWLREMYDPFFDFFFAYMKNEHDQHHNAVGPNPDGSVMILPEGERKRIDHASTGMVPLVKLYASKNERELNFEFKEYETSVGSLYEWTCTIDGIELGRAARADRKVAKNVAAWEAAKKLGLAADSEITTL